MLSIKKLIEDLDYWIFLGIGSDIIELKNQRVEYAHLVEKHLKSGADEKEVPTLVLAELQKEYERPLVLQKTFWRLLWLAAKNFIRNRG